jgi:hypothetical protein
MSTELIEKDSPHPIALRMAPNLIIEKPPSPSRISSAVYSSPLRDTRTTQATTKRIPTMQSKESFWPNLK